MRAKFVRIVAGKLKCARPGCGRRLFFGVELEREDGTRFVIGEDCANEIGLRLPRDYQMTLAKAVAVETAIQELIPNPRSWDEYVMYYQRNRSLFGDRGNRQVLRHMIANLDKDSAA